MSSDRFEKAYNLFFPFKKAFGTKEECEELSKEVQRSNNILLLIAVARKLKMYVDPKITEATLKRDVLSGLNRYCTAFQSDATLSDTRLSKTIPTLPDLTRF